MIVENQNMFCLLAAAEKAAEEACHSGQTAFKWVHYYMDPEEDAMWNRVMNLIGGPIWELTAKD